MPSMLDRIGPAPLALSALAAFGLSTVVSRGPTIVLVLLATLALGLSIAKSRSEVEVEPDLGRWVFGITALFGILSIVGPAHDVIGSPPGWAFPLAGLVWIGLGLIWLVSRSSTNTRRTIYVACLLATAFLGAVHVISAEGVGFDVLLLHEAAADAIADGLSPYSAAVTAPNGAPVGDPFIVGYPYPPLTALSYSVGEWTTGDPRWTSLVGWLVVLAVLGARSWRDDGSDAPLGTMLVAAAIPGWPLVLTAGWTESLSLALLAIAVALWSRPRLSGGISGLFLGSKQYLLAGAPLYLTNRQDARWTRALWAGAGMVLAFLPVLVWGVPDFIDAAIRFHLEAPARPDGSSLAGLLDMMSVEWSPPVWIMGVVVISLAIVLGRLVDDLPTWLAALGVILSAALFLSSQAFTNYWFLMAGIAALTTSAVTMRREDPTPPIGRPRDVATTGSDS